jgi:hypothetical protein
MEAAVVATGHGKAGREVRAARVTREEIASTQDRRAMSEGMQAIQPLVRQCYLEHREKGVADVGIEVGRRGEVKRVTVAGPLARTPTAGCLKAAVKRARFRGGGLRFHYPLVLQ